MRHLGEGAGPQGGRPLPLAGSYRPIRCPSLNTGKCAALGPHILDKYRPPWESPEPPAAQLEAVVVVSGEDISPRAPGALLLAVVGALNSAAGLSSAAAAAVDAAAAPAAAASAESASGVQRYPRVDLRVRSAAARPLRGHR